MASVLGLAQPLPALDPPYPQSPLIQSVTWAPVSDVIRLTPGTDNWPLTWADDDFIYGTGGDGKAFDGSRASCWVAKIAGTPPNLQGQNVYLLDDNGGGAAGRKGSGILCVNGVLYIWLINANFQGKESQLAWSNDHGKTWNFCLVR